ncbi:hypothetical protein [Pseudomonas schmalbachii]|uniref:Uncharacterized protein n=1 Tax=Pseudomonas schmalbachii TaxID=2816993 RepID=A0ABS3TVG8_9PSED|nr:hypothetical protein [Pseudomonas schmalbachii]MBO3277660.1 hypothetical protein [Pseudomonas schmalbachii]
MKLEITRGLLLVAALGVATLAAAAWQEPSLSVIKTGQGAATPHAPARVQTDQRAQPDSNLLLLMFGLSQGTGAQWR